ncbi:MAG: pentapeptide repeat-containing protein [Mycolicibacterium sp.]|uniref:pentapeptide repeat-containing protein n=1 Tax=Mycolicibacterium sp. TaxID=2320850 RepID=UPI003D0A525B
MPEAADLPDVDATSDAEPEAEMRLEVAAAATETGGDVRQLWRRLTVDDIIIDQAVPVSRSVTRANFAEAIMRTSQAFDTVINDLSSPEGQPIGDLLAGVLWLVRRAILPTGRDVGFGGTAACVQTGDCSGQDLRGANLAGQTLIGVDFTGTNLRYANFGGAHLVDVSFSGADLRNAKIAATLLLDTDFTDADFRGVIFNDGYSQAPVLVGDGGGGDILGPVGPGGPAGPMAKPASINDLATAPPSDRVMTQGAGYHYTDKVRFDKAWYQSNGVINQFGQPSFLRGTEGAPIELGFSDELTDHDGVKGMIKNFTGEPIFVKAGREVWSGHNGVFGDPIYQRSKDQTALLLPGDQMSYIVWGSDLERGYGLRLSKARCGSWASSCHPSGEVFELLIRDDQWSKPDTEVRFGDRGFEYDWQPPREDWNEGDHHTEIRGETNVWVKRETDGWQIPQSEEFTRRTRTETNIWHHSDFAIFTIHVNSLSDF